MKKELKIYFNILNYSIDDDDDDDDDKQIYFK